MAVSDLIGSGISAGLSGGLSSGVSGLITAPVSLGLSAASSAMQYNKQKKLMQRAHQYELENLAAQDQYQRKMIEDANLLTKSSLMRAGYSTADPSGTGVTPASLSTPSTSSTGSASLPSVGADFSGARSYSDLMSGELARSQVALNEIEAKYRARKLEGEIGKLNIEIDSMKAKLPEEVSILKQEVQNKAQEWNLNQKEIERISADIDRLKAVAENVSIDNRFKPDMQQSQINKLKRECTVLLHEGKIKEVEAQLADNGILIGADWFTTLAAIASRGHSVELLQRVSSMIGQVTGALPSAGATLLGALGDEIINSAASAGSRAGSWLGKIVSGKD